MPVTYQIQANLNAVVCVFCASSPQYHTLYFATFPLHEVVTLKIAMYQYERNYNQIQK